MSDKIDLTPWENHDGPPPDFDSPVYPVFDSGVTWTIGQLAVVLNIDCNDFSWDAATEEFEGDVRAVIGNAITAALGEEWSDLRAENARLRDALERLLKTARLLQQNAEGCAVNHYGEDFQMHGMPGWLIDTASDIARAALKTKGTRDE